MNLLNKLISGSDQRINRFRDAKNNSIHLKNYIYFFYAVIEKILLMLKIESNLPIINYDAIKIFKILLKNKISVLEFGSGRSTIWWLKQNIKKIVSVESDKFWNKNISKKLYELNNRKIDYVFTKNIKKYTSVGKKEKFDLIIVDGIFRDKCINYILKYNIHKNTIIYLDDSDADCSIQKKYSKFSEARKSEYLMLKHSLEYNRVIYHCRNFSPTHLFVKEGSFSIPRSFEKVFKKIIS